MAITIDVGGLEDARDAADLHLRTVTTAYVGIFPPEAPAPAFDELHDQWVSLLADPDTTVLLARDGRSIVGSVVARPDRDHVGMGQIGRLHVDPQRWRSGVGSMLVAAACADLVRRGFERAGLWVLEENVRARRFYERIGWVLEPGLTKTWHGGAVIEVRYTTALPADGVCAAASCSPT